MSLSAPYQEHYYIADGEMVIFPFGEFFQALSQNYVKCVIYFSDGTSCVPTFTVDMENQQITIVTLTKPDGTVLTVPPAGSVVRVYRETPEQQNVTASQLQNYTAKQLEKIFDSMVAMQQETSYSDLHKNIRLTEPQRDISIEPLTALYAETSSADVRTDAARSRFPFSSPVSMKSAFRCPSMVQAFAYGPEYPFVLNPMPFLLILKTLTAV